MNSYKASKVIRLNGFTACLYHQLTRVTCTVRLVGGAGQLEGRLEVVHDGVWGTVCDNGFTDEEAIIVCRTLGIR